MYEYFLGIDGGATKTHAALFSKNRECLCFIETGATNHEKLPHGFVDLKKRLGCILSEFKQRFDLDVSKTKAVLGLSGIDTPFDLSQGKEILTGLGLREPLLCNDAFLGIPTGSLNGYGICSVNGTGCTVVARTQEGNLFQLGGYGEAFGDPGGGSILGKFALSSAYNHIYRKGPYTKMSSLLMDVAETAERKLFLGILRDSICRKELRYSELAPIVYQAAREGDSLAINFLIDMGKELGKNISILIENMPLSEVIPVVLAGSLHVKGAYHGTINALKKTVLKAYPEKNIHYTILESPPVAGAVFWAIQESGISYDINTHDIVIKEITRLEPEILSFRGKNEFAPISK